MKDVGIIVIIRMDEAKRVKPLGESGFLADV